MGRPGAPQGSFADLEFAAQGIALEAPLRAIAEFLDEQGDLVALVHQDLVRGLKHPQRGRDGLAADHVLRAFVLQRVKNWDLRELRERIADGYTLRGFTLFYSHPVPKHDAFHRAFSRLTPQTVRALNAAVVQAAVTLGLEDGRQLRVDTCVVETDIHLGAALLRRASRVRSLREGWSDYFTRLRRGRTTVGVGDVTGGTTPSA